MFPVGGLKHVMNQDLDGTARGESIDYLVLDCLYRFRYSTEYCLCRLKTASEGLKASEKDAQLQKEYCERHPNKPTPGSGRLYKTVTQAAFRQKLKKMEKAGLITKFELYIGRSKYGYRLTKLGAQKLQKYNEDLTIDFNNLCGVISPSSPQFVDTFYSYI